MSKIIVFAKEGFAGRRSEFNSNVHDLEEVGFNKVILSIKVIGTPWVAYYEKNYTGRQHVFEEGEYPILEDKAMFSSLKIVNDDLSDPEIELFEHVQYQGRRVTLRSETNLQEISFSDTASSHIVKGGVWVLYAAINRQGSQLITFPGDKIPSYLPIHFNDEVTWLRPLVPKP